MSHHIFDVIPQQVLEYWLSGRYQLGGHRSLDYDLLGWGLMLRGLYKYRVLADERSDDGELQSKFSHCGYCFLDFEGRGLYFGGIRLCSAAQMWEIRAPGYWRSHSARIHREAGEDYALTFDYRLATVVLENAKETHERVRQEVLGDRDVGCEEELTQEHEKAAVSYLEKDFDEHWKLFGPSKTDILGLVHIGDLPRPTNEALSFKGDYAIINRMQKRGDPAFTGSIEFKRILR